MIVGESCFPFEERDITIQCPKCGQTYTIHEKDLNHGLVDCWNNNCRAKYVQKLHNINNFGFVRAALHRVGGN